MKKSPLLFPFPEYALLNKLDLKEDGRLLQLYSRGPVFLLRAVLKVTISY